MTIQVFGLPVSQGIAIGRAVLIASSRVDVAHYYVEGTEAQQAEIDRLKRARDHVIDELTLLKTDIPKDAPSELLALLDVHLMLLNDEGLIDATQEWVHKRAYNAEWALSSQLEVMTRQFDEMDDEYLRERRADIEQLTERMLRALADQKTRLSQPKNSDKNQSESSSRSGAMDDPEDPVVLVASDIAPADMLQFKRSIFSGFVTDVGGRTSHTAIVARSMAIPAVVGAREASRLIRQDDWIVIDGDAGVVIVNPSAIILDEYRFKRREIELERARLDRLRHTPAVTLDGVEIELLANIEQPSDVQQTIHAGAAGVGLFRTEFLFMHRNGHLPDEDEQYTNYTEALKGLNGHPLTIRTVDVGADKPLDRMTTHELRHEHILNPAMGMRAIRWSLSEPAMFQTQLRAILRASAHGKVRMLLPMLAQIAEIRSVRQQIMVAKRQLSQAGFTFGDIEVGAMIEVPAAALMAATFARDFDFISIGTNDLIQYTLAIDRADEQVAHLYDPWHPAILRLIHQTISAAKSAGCPVSICGEMAGDVAFTDLLLAMGLRSFSMHPSRIAEVKQVILRADVRRLGSVLDRILLSDNPEQTAKTVFDAVHTLQDAAA